MALRKNKIKFPARLAGLGHDPGKKVMQGALLVLLLLIGSAHLKSAFLAQLAMNKGPQMADFSRSLTQADALALLARKEHLTNGNLPGALRLYRRSLAYFVLDVPSWLGIAELFNDLGQKDKAVSALQFVESFAANSKDTAWTKALIANDLDREDILEDNLAWLAANFPGKLPEILSLAELRWQEPAIIMQHFGPSLYPGLLHYFIRMKEQIKAETVWKKIEKTGMIARDTALDYVNFLLHQGDIEQAGLIWKDHYLQEDSLLFNPDLKEPFLGSGFAWRISRARSVSWQPLPGRKGLRIHFDGTENVSFQLRQIVPLPPDKYVFKGNIISQDLTTDQLPYWSISGYKCQGLNITGAIPPSSADRREFSLPFTVPDGCSAIQVSLRRNTSYFFDNKIAGTLVIDGLNIEPQNPTAETTDLPQNPLIEAGIPSSAETGININRIIVQ